MNERKVSLPGRSRSQSGAQSLSASGPYSSGSGRVEQTYLCSHIPRFSVLTKYYQTFARKDYVIKICKMNNHVSTKNWVAYVCLFCYAKDEINVLVGEVKE